MFKYNVKYPLPPEVMLLVIIGDFSSLLLYQAIGLNFLDWVRAGADPPRLRNKPNTREPACHRAIILIVGGGAETKISSSNIEIKLQQPQLELNYEQDY